MAEYIEREAALCVADYAKDEHPYDLEKGLVLITDVYNKGWNDACNYIRDKLECVLAADVAPVVHARWDEIPNEYMSVASKTGSYHGNATTCSACHEINPNALKTNNCPNCGARCDK